MLGIQPQAGTTMVIAFRTIPNITQLRTETYKGSPVYLSGRSVANDGGEGNFVWNPTSIADDNGGTIFKVAGVDVGRWERKVTDNLIPASWFGVLGDGAADNIDSFLAAQSYIDSIGGGTLIFPEGIVGFVGRAGLNGRGFSIYNTNYPIHVRGQYGKSTTVKNLGLGGQVQVRAFTIKSQTQKTVISNLIIDGNNAALPVETGQRAGIFVTDSTGVEIKDLKVINTEGDGITITGGAIDTYVYNCHLDFNLRNGITLGGSTEVKNTTVEKCFIGENIGTQQFDMEPTGGSIDGVNIINSYFKKLTEGAADQYAIVVSSAKNVNVSGSYIYNPLLVRTSDSVVFSNNPVITTDNVNNNLIKIDYTATNVVFSNNPKMESLNGLPSIVIRQVSSNRPNKVKFIGNNVYSDNQCLLFEAGNNLNLSHNSFTTTNAAVDALEFAATALGESENTIISNNTVNGGISSLYFRYTLTNRFRGSKITGNTFENFAGTYAIKLSSAAVELMLDTVCIGNTVPAAKQLFTTNHAISLIVAGSLGKGNAVYSVKLAPEGNLTGWVGDTATVRSGASGATFYRKETGAGTTAGWVVNNSTGKVRKEMNIGDWDMTDFFGIGVAHGLTDVQRKTINILSISIRDDADNIYYINSPEIKVSTDVNDIIFARVADDIFDSVDFDALGYNRGKILFEYTP